VKICHVIWIKWISWFEKMSTLSPTLLSKWCHNNKHFSELASHHGGKTAGIDMVWRNYVTVTLCILSLLQWMFSGGLLHLIIKRWRCGQCSLYFKCYRSSTASVPTSWHGNIITNALDRDEQTITTTTVSRSLYRATCISQHPQLTSGDFEQNLTARMPLLAATCTLRLERRC